MNNRDLIIAIDKYDTEEALRLIAEIEDVNFQVRFIPGTSLFNKSIPVNYLDMCIALHSENINIIPISKIDKPFNADELKQLEQSDPETQKRLILKKCHEGYNVILERTPLQRAAEKGQTELVRALIDKGADVNLKIYDLPNISDAKTALELVITSSRTWKGFDEAALAVLKILIDNGADLRFDSNRTVFHLPRINAPESEDVRGMFERAWVKQCEENIRNGIYSDPRIQIKDLKLLKIIADRSGDMEAKKTLELFKHSALESTSKLLVDAKAPIFKMIKGFISKGKLEEIGRTPDGNVIYKEQEVKKINSVDRSEQPIYFSMHKGNPLVDPNVLDKIIEFGGMSEFYGLSWVCKPPKVEVKATGTESASSVDDITS